MDANLHRLISDYQATVALRFSQLLEAGIDAPKSNFEWVGNGIEQIGQLLDGSWYFKHGFGCAIKSESDAVDFDFGLNGEIDGFDSWRLWKFAAASKKDYGFASIKDISAAIKKELTEGTLRYSGDLVYCQRA